MLGKTSKPVIEILTGSLCSGSGSPRSQIQSPRGLKSLDLGTVGLGIVAALENSSGGGRDGILGRNSTRSSPIPVNFPQNCCRSRTEEVEVEMEMEEYTIVTCHSPSNRNRNSNSVFHISPARGVEDGGAAPAAEFLSRCDLCRKKLDGRDIYMYRGEKAFCSADCRYTQMVMDKCSAEASKPAEVAGSPCDYGQMFTAGILAS
ncbi:hypothetical protein SASPL_129701 [Salvia splendens]|uniref:FLZ-type domain-containing protein n=1 Tax=Salvia splendens TaxID=180675 RepID=A0A8X8XGK7_SALSN|nr:FCS-Like Zinc finger 13-like [Salvia splendens]KAG6411618.1 hypothetical protein SASPL_129701 [Salvia splendens]